MKMAVLYYTRTGNTRAMAEVVVEGMRKVEGVEAKAFALDEIDAEWVKDCKCVVVGTPTYLATFAGEIKMWLDNSARQYGLAGKIGGAFATQDYLHGGGDIAVQAILAHLLVQGMLVYSGGGALGKPVIHLGPVAMRESVDAAKATFMLYGERMAMKTREVFA